MSRTAVYNGASAVREAMMETWAWIAISGLLLWVLVGPGRQRLALSRAKHPSLAGHGRIAQFLAARLRGYSFDESGFFAADKAPDAVVQTRRQGFEHLVERLNSRSKITAAASASLRPQLSDLEFTSAYRVPFPFSPYLRSRLALGSMVASSHNGEIEDLDGTRFIDLSGSYGVNVLGYDFYKTCIDEAASRARALGPVLGQYHPAVLFNVEQLRAISGLDEVSFHMSGTEAVMQAVRLARYHTGRTHLVRFCGAYHGWWEDVQPGPGNPVQPRETYTLRDMDDRSLGILERRRDIACVLVNPLQALHPNRPAPGDSTLVDSGRSAGFDRTAYAAWLQRLRDVCSRRGIVLILDEVFLGFRLAPGGAQEYFGVNADMVTYGKTLGGGLPVGVLCGRARFMRRYRPDHPADICFARGTFNAHPYVMCAMQVFLERLATPAVRALYDNLDQVWNDRAASLNAALAAAAVPVRVANMSTVWTVLYTQPSRYNWMFQFYLREAGLLLSWVGSGRVIFSLDCDAQRFATIAERFVSAARAMQQDGWWYAAPDLSNRAIRRAIRNEMLARLPMIPAHAASDR
jgi:glutamate-1-semialdehyde 2,1-aminomutase